MGKDSSPEETSDEETPNGIDVAIRFIDLRLKELESLKQHTLERAKLELCLASGVAQEQQNGKTNYQTKPTRLLFSTILLE